MHATGQSPALAGADSLMQRGVWLQGGARKKKGAGGGGGGWAWKKDLASLYSVSDPIKTGFIYP